MPPIMISQIMFPPGKVGKPGSVYDDHLSRCCVATAFQPSPHGPRTAVMPFHDVAPGGVYKAGMSPYRR